MQVMNRAFNVVRNAFSSGIRRAENAQIEERAQGAAEEARQSSASLNEATAGAIAQLKALDREIANEKMEYKTFHDRAVLADGNGNADLARKFALDMAASEKRLAKLEDRHAGAEAKVNEFKQKARSYSSKAEEAKDRARDIVVDNRFADAEAKVQKTIDGIAGSSAIDTLDSLEAKVAEKADKNQAMAELSGLKAQQDIEAMEQNQAADAILARLRQSSAAPAAESPAAGTLSDTSQSYNIAS